MIVIIWWIYYHLVVVSVLLWIPRLFDLKIALLLTVEITTSSFWTRSYLLCLASSFYQCYQSMYTWSKVSLLRSEVKIMCFRFDFLEHYVPIGHILTYQPRILIHQPHYTMRHLSRILMHPHKGACTLSRLLSIFVDWHIRLDRITEVGQHELCDCKSEFTRLSFS